MAGNLNFALKAAAGLILAAMLGYGFFLSNQNERLHSQLELLEKETAGLKQELELNYRALLVREQERKRFQREKDDLAKELEKYYETDCQASAWADAPCPAGVLERLR